ncbi:HAD domain-containing protein [Streptomyces sp. Da 82-17]|uniref:HAD domain-containing protein n=1 Tax=Streptomyces sp. Da 82-17 TaxID=3377116 RepID=UPI0038D3F93F
MRPPPPARPRPLLFLDVDGPLIPFGAPEGYPAYGGGDTGGNPLLARLDPALGPRLAGLGCALVWATTWGEDANAELAPRLGLPRLPVLPYPEENEEGEGSVETAYEGSTIGLHWKTRPIVDRAAGRPFVWVDDEIADADRRWVAAHHPGRALLHRVDARHGLRESDFAAIRAWLGRD